MGRTGLFKVDKQVLMGLLFVAWGLASQFYAAWSIDFAFITAVRDRSCVAIPLYGACIDIGAWWNMHFFLLFPIGAILMIMGAYIVGVAIGKIRNGNSK